MSHHSRSARLRREVRICLLPGALVGWLCADALQMGADVRMGREVARHEQAHRGEWKQHDDGGRHQRGVRKVARLEAQMYITLSGSPFLDVLLQPYERKTIGN